MARPRVRFVCQQCGTPSVKWQGRCSDCQAWNTLVEEIEPSRRATPLAGNAGAAGNAPVSLADVRMEPEPRYRSGVTEFDRVAGGGLVPGALLLVGGPPGIGKSTLLLQVAEGVGRGGGGVLYVTGEESLAQVRMRAERLRVSTPRLQLLSEIDLEVVLARARECKPRLLLVDSIQTLCHPEVASAPGGVAQVRECTSGLVRLAKGEGITVILVGHVTKDGSLAGPRVMEHLVDTVLYFEGDGLQNHRVLKATKNRFGPTHEVGLFEMRSEGLVDVPNASEFFLSQRSADAPGTCVVPIMEGTRSLLVEVQALVIPSGYNYATRRATGLDTNRTVMLLAVLQKRGRLRFMGKRDVFVNVAGGMDVEEPAADLGTLVAAASSAKDSPVREATAVMGEVGLGGEVRAVSQVELRVAECVRMGLRRVVLPQGNLAGRGALLASSACELVGVSNVCEALQACIPWFAGTPEAFWSEGDNDADDAPARRAPAIAGVAENGRRSGRDRAGHSDDAIEGRPEPDWLETAESERHLDDEAAGRFRVFD